MISLHTVYQKVAWPVCEFVGHDWSVAPPWSDADLDAVHCERCGIDPVENEHVRVGASQP